MIITVEREGFVLKNRSRSSSVLTCLTFEPMLHCPLVVSLSASSLPLAHTETSALDFCMGLTVRALSIFRHPGPHRCHRYMHACDDRPLLHDQCASSGDPFSSPRQTGKGRVSGAGRRLVSTLFTLENCLANLQLTRSDIIVHTGTAVYYEISLILFEPFHVHLFPITIRAKSSICA